MHVCWRLVLFSSIDISLCLLNLCERPFPLFSSWFPLFCPIHAFFCTKGCGSIQRMSLAIAWSYHINIVWVCCGHLWLAVGKLLAGVPLSSCTRGRVMTSVDLISKTNTISKNTPLEIWKSLDLFQKKKIKKVMKAKSSHPSGCLSTSLKNVQFWARQ